MKRFREFRCRGLTRPTTGGAGCCARATRGQAVAAPPRSVMKSRRRMCPSERCAVGRVQSAGAWGRPSFSVLLPILGWVHDSDHPLAARIKVNVVDLDGLVVTAPMPIECLQQVSLQFE